jgi:hypothetical protein
MMFGQLPGAVNGIGEVDNTPTWADLEARFDAWKQGIRDYYVGEAREELTPEFKELLADERDHYITAMAAQGQAYQELLDQELAERDAKMRETLKTVGLYGGAAVLAFMLLKG